MLSIHDFATHKCHPIHPIHGPLWTGADPFALSASRVHDENLCRSVSFDHSSCWSTLWRIETDVGSLTRPQSYPLIASDDEMLFSSSLGRIYCPSILYGHLIYTHFFLASIDPTAMVFGKSIMRLRPLLPDVHPAFRLIYIQAAIRVMYYCCCCRLSLYSTKRNRKKSPSGI